MGHHAEESFDEFAVFAVPRLRQVANAWSRDRHRAEDAVQGTLERVFAAWPRVRRGEAYGYARTTLVRLLISEERRPWHRHEVTSEDPGQHERLGPDHPTAEGTLEQDDDGAALLAALADLPARQRAVVVLRYLEGLTVTETARTLRCSEGTVKSQAHDARRALRERLTSTADVDVEGAPR